MNLQVGRTASEEALAALVTRDAMVGVAKVALPPISTFGASFRHLRLWEVATRL